MKNKKILLYIIPFLLLIPVFFLICPGKIKPLEGEVTFLTGTLAINSTKAEVGSRVIKNDILITGEKSQAVIQLSDSAVITMQPETELIFENISDGSSNSGTASLILNKGTTLHKVLKSGSKYSVKAPTAVASVRGTSFEMSADEKRTFIKVTAGTVYVKKISEKARADKKLTENQEKGAEEIILREGDSLEIYTLGSGAMGYSDGSISNKNAADSSIPDDNIDQRNIKQDQISADKKSAVSKTASKRKTTSGSAKSAVKEKSDATGTKYSGKKTSSGKKSGSTASGDTVKETATGKKTVTQETKNIKKSGDSGNGDKTITGKGKNKALIKDTAAVQKIKGSANDSSTDRINNAITDPSINKKGGESVEQDKTPDSNEVAALINKKDRNLNDIKKVYNRIDKVNLYSGKIITGAIIERGETYTILTTDGIEKVSRRDIQSNEIVK